MVDPVESTRNRCSMPPVSGEEDNGVVCFEFKGDDILVGVDDSEDELRGNGGSGRDFSLGELLGDGIGLFENEDIIDG